MAEEQRIGDYPATITPIGYVDVDEEIWNVASLLGCGGNVIVNVETIIDHLEGEDSLTEDEEKCLNFANLQKNRISEISFYLRKQQRSPM